MAYKKIKKLPKTLDVENLGISNLTTTLVKRKRVKAIYLRSDGYYEVFKIPVMKVGEKNGRKLLEEIYPPPKINNPKYPFYCVKNRKLAEKYFRKIK